MKHRDRVLTALNHEEPDRCPMQISFAPEFASGLKKDLNQNTEKIHNPHGGGNTYELERVLDEDILLTSVGWENSYYAFDFYDVRGDRYTDEWGVEWRIVKYETKFGKGHYTEISGHPLFEDKLIASYKPPDPDRPELYDDASQTIEKFKEEYWIAGVTGTVMFEGAWALRGFERLMMDFVSNPDIVRNVFDIVFNYHLTAAIKLVEMGVDMIHTGDDVGGQDAMLISVDTWRRFFKPYLAKFISTLKNINPEIKISYHSDGEIYSIIPDLIEIGLDVLNPIQPKSMNPEKLKREYGDKLCFWGSIDEQFTLPFGTAEDVRKEVITRLKTIGKNGGLIIGPTHNVQLDTPAENFWSMVNTIVKTQYCNL